MPTKAENFAKKSAPVFEIWIFENFHEKVILGVSLKSTGKKSWAYARMQSAQVDQIWSDLEKNPWSEGQKTEFPMCPTAIANGSEHII